MVAKVMTVQCSKERELGEMATHLVNISEKIDDIHYSLYGNGKPGILNEFNQWKGAIKLFMFISSILIAILGAVHIF